MKTQQTQKTKTYTCSFCQKVGSDFCGMAEEICPKNGGYSSHQVPMMGDRS